MLTSLPSNSNLGISHSFFDNNKLSFSNIINAVFCRNSKYFFTLSAFLKSCEPLSYSENLSNIPPFSAKIRLYNSGLVELFVISIFDIIAIYNITGIPITSKLFLSISFLFNAIPVIFL